MLRGEPTKHDWLDESSESLGESLWKLVVAATTPAVGDMTELAAIIDGNRKKPQKTAEM